MKLLYVAKENSRIDLNGPLVARLKELGDLTVYEHAKDFSEQKMSELIRGTDILLTIWDSMPVPTDIALNPGNLKYICNISGTVRKFIPIEIIEAGILVTNWGDSPANNVAEGAFALLMSVMKNVPAQIQNIREDRWHLDLKQHGFASLDGLNVGIFGFGVIGRRFAEMLQAFNPVIRVFDPFVEQVPDYCLRVSSLDELFSQSEAIVIHAGLNDDTYQVIKARHLAMLPDQGIIINTARGGIIDQEALFAELEKGRLRAGIDVLDFDEVEELPAGHPARKWTNCMFTCHDISKHNWPAQSNTLSKKDRVCVENIQRFIHGEQPVFTIDLIRYMRST